MMRNLIRLTMLTLLGCMGIWLMGCARTVTETTINPNGSWTRKITFHGPKSNPNGVANGNAGKNGAQELNPFASLMPKLEDMVRVPSGPEWKVSREAKDDETVIIAERAFQPGETLHGDIAIKAASTPEALNIDLFGGDQADAQKPAKKDDKKPAKKADKYVMVNDVSVKQIEPGVWKYTEVLHWIGPPAQELALDPTALATVKKALPPALATDANVKDVTKKFTQEFLRVLFGPSDPLLADIFTFMMQPELMERRIMKRMGGRLNVALQQKFGAQMTEEQRLTAIRQIVSSATNMVSDKGKSGPGMLGNIGNNAGNIGNNAGNNDSSFGAVSLFLSVKMPGHVIETNGEQDEIRGDVYWAVYPMAASLGDITLTATCKMNPQAGSK